MVRSSLIDRSQHENKLCCTDETSAEFYIFKIHSALDNASPHFAWYGKNPIIHKLREFLCDIYPITPKPKKLYNIKQEGSFIGYTNIISTKEW